MHSTNLPPAGKGVELTELDDGFYVKSRIVEPVAMKLALENVYGSYSVGISKPRIVRDGRAKGGRIIDGVISEVSLVDFPANTTCKAMVVKMADDGELEEVGGTETIKTAMTDLEVEKVAADNEEKCDKCGGEGSIDGEKCEKCEGSGLAKSEEPEIEKAETTDIPDTVKQLHDATCSTIEWDEVVKMHPDIEKNGLALTLGPQVLTLLGQMLAHEVEEDAGSGKEAYGILSLAQTYCDLSGFFAQEKWEDAMGEVEGILMSGRADLTKSVEEAEAEKNARSYYTNAAKEQAVVALRAVHDTLAGLWPDVCTAGAHGDAAPDTDPGPVDQLADTKVMDMKADAKPEPVAEPEQYVRAVEVPELVKAAMSDEFEQFRSQLDERDQKIQDLKDEVDKMAAAPDPAQAPFRGKSGVLEDPIKEVEVPAEPDPMIEHLQALVKSGHPELAQTAQGMLTKLAAANQ